MKLFYFILSLCLFAFAVTQAQEETDPDGFTIQFYKYPNYVTEEGIISGSVSVGGGGGAKSGNMSVGSFTANSFLQVTLFSEKYYKGKKHVYVGSKKNIKPALHVGSVKWKRLN
ncbi:hypothetical protein HPULCUR_009946 [Helicostylum pulchrum]|uniref:Uncharacterized protein n=1 Tax=Helicostylum pulchrum TaxID=562976 RepID=A0ABP9YBX6_9FUNG